MRIVKKSLTFPLEPYFMLSLFLSKSKCSQKTENYYTTRKTHAQIQI